MQTIEERSKRFIEDHIDELRAIARRIVTTLREPSSEDYDPIREDWQGVTVQDGKAVLINDLPAGAEIANDDCLADLNIWYDETRNGFSVVVHPMAVNDGIIQTDCRTFTELLGPTENSMKGEKAYRAVLAHYYREGNIEAGIVDLLTDLMHLADEGYGGPSGFAEMLSIARECYNRDTGGEQ